MSDTVTWRIAPLLLTFGLLAAACSSSGDDDDGAGGETATTEPATSAAPTTADEPATSAATTVAETTTTAAPATTAPTTTAGPVPLAEVAVALTNVTDLDQPIVMAVRAGDDAMYIGERVGRVRAVSDERGDVVLDISDRTTAEGERGLLGLAFSPDGSKMYVSSTDLAGDSLVEEYAVDANGVADVASRRTVLTIDQPYPNHNGGNVVFGPDGYLYLGFGDGGSGGDPERRALNGSTLLGKMLRIDPSTPSAGVGYTVPADNPFVGTPGILPEIWSNGLRNPWRFSFDSATGDLWIGDVGQGEWEEIDHAPVAAGAGRGVSFGWSAFEGTQPFNADQPADGHVAPVLEYGHGDSECSVTGGYVYRGSRIPGLTGAYLYGDYCSGTIWAIRVVDGAVTEQVVLGEVRSIISFGQDADGELYALSQEGQVLRIDPA